MTAPDPVDLRLLALLARSGRAAVHEMAAELGMDPREVATRLVTLSANGVPVIVGAECDQNALARLLAGYQRPGPQQGFPGQQARPVPGQQPFPGAFPGQQPGQVPGYRPPQVPQGFPAAQPPAAQPAQVGPPTGGQVAVPDAVHTWGLPQSASWARGDQVAEPPRPPAPGVGTAQTATGPQGEQLRITLVEVVDPADFLFAAAGHTLANHERAVVVHTEVTNLGERPYAALPDQYLMLGTADGHTLGKAPTALASRPPHVPGVPPGQTVGGHAVYVIGQRTRIVEVRWQPGRDAGDGTLTWSL